MKKLSRSYVHPLTTRMLVMLDRIFGRYSGGEAEPGPLFLYPGQPVIGPVGPGRTRP